MPLRDKILGATKRRYAESTLVIDGETIVVGIESWTEKERSAFEMVRDGCRDDADRAARLEDIRRRLIVDRCVDPQTKQKLFGPLDVPALEHIDGIHTAKLFDDIAKHVGLWKSDIEELLKNSETAPAPEQATN